LRNSSFAPSGLSLTGRHSLGLRRGLSLSTLRSFAGVPVPAF
jgi:hypothetical protein